MQNAPRCLKLDECVLAAVFNFGFEVGVGQFDAACRGVGLRVIGTASEAMWFWGWVRKEKPGRRGTFAQTATWFVADGNAGSQRSFLDSAYHETKEKNFQHF